ncbi:hypothetical protein VNO80_15654 [Phaseolus coccineus]|uniref:Pectinesterase inhibitor domain-containing protein n=1 Tax=Phaseolus coccineus TaxID=3886 RepID=A0AAN9MQA4_PHACN
MESKINSFWILVTCMCVIVVHHQANAEEQLIGRELIKSVCKTRGNDELCEQVLMSNPISERATLEDLAMIVLKAAAENASGILLDAKKMIDDPFVEPTIQQGLADCKENLLDAESQIQDTVASILSNDKLDAQLWLKAALAAIDTCDDSIPGDDDILSRRSVTFRQLCNIAVAINKKMMGIHS